MGIAAVDLSVPTSPAAAYREVLFSPVAERVLRQGNIIPPEMSVGGLISRVLSRFAVVEGRIAEVDGVDDLLAEFHDLMRDGVVLLGSPLLTNIANGGNRPLASCSAVPIAATVGRTQEMAESYYLQNMGSGFDLSHFSDPASVLEDLNAHAASVEDSGRCERYVGNMAHLDVDHPKIKEFVDAKVINPSLLHFNISVNVNDTFMEAVKAGARWQMSDGSRIDAETLWRHITEAAHACGDPGILSLDRLNAHNPLFMVSPYVTTAPCAEVGLAEGETCVFGYINLAPLVRLDSSGVPRLDFDRLGSAARVLTRILDDAVEYSSETQPVQVSRWQHRFGRKIGIGLCGYVDALMLAGLPYGSEPAVQLLKDAIATLNYESKVQSAELAERRGAFLGFATSTFARTTSWVDRFTMSPTRIGAESWRALGERVARVGMRNSMTSALPPSGRVSLLLGVSSSIEPYLTLGREEMHPISLHVLGAWLDGSAPGVTWPARRTWGYDDVVRDAYSVSIDEHLVTVSAAAASVDDGVSKTLNLPESATVSDVDRILKKAWAGGLKAMSVYRRGSHPSFADSDPEAAAQ